MSKHFSAGFFKGNRDRLQELFTGTAPIVIPANGLMQKSTDTTYPFKQDSNFWYLTGINEPNLTLVIDKNKTYLMVPTLSETREKFDGSINTDALSKISGIDEVVNEVEGWRRLGSRLKKASNVAILAPPKGYIEQLGMYTSPAKKRLIAKIKKANSEIDLLDLRPHLQRMRMVKQAEEISAIQKAIDITAESLKKIRIKYRKGAYSNEFEIEQDLTGGFFAGGGEGHSFDPIIAAGIKACTIHPTGNINKIRKTDSLLLDVGASYESYAADISRSWHNKPTRRYTAVYEAVKDVSDYATSLLKIGVVLPEYEKKVEVYMGEKLRELGLISSIESEEVRKYFPHATSHFLGIDVHDVGDYETPLSEDIVLTVEPGIYIPEEGIGIRIEDDIQITSNGPVNLSAGLTRNL